MNKNQEDIFAELMANPYSSKYLRGYILHTLCEAIEKHTLSLEEVKLHAIDYHIQKLIRTEDLYCLEEYEKSRDMSVFSREFLHMRFPPVSLFQHKLVQTE